MSTIASSANSRYADYLERELVSRAARSSAAVTETFVQLGWPVSLAKGIGILELTCLVVYIVPPTAVLGALLLTGYLGGAVATHVRIGNPLFSHTLFPVYIGLLLWGALFLRDARVRALISIRR